MISSLHRNTAGSIVMFCIVTSRSTCTPRPVRARLRRRERALDLDLAVRRKHPVRDAEAHLARQAVAAAFFQRPVRDDGGRVSKEHVRVPGDIALEEPKVNLALRDDHLRALDVRLHAQRQRGAVLHAAQQRAIDARNLRRGELHHAHEFPAVGLERAVVWVYQALVVVPGPGELDRRGAVVRDRDLAVVRLRRQQRPGEVDEVRVQRHVLRRADAGEFERLDGDGGFERPPGLGHPRRVGRVHHQRDVALVVLHVRGRERDGELHLGGRREDAERRLDDEDALLLRMVPVERNRHRRRVSHRDLPREEYSRDRVAEPHRSAKLAFDDVAPVELRDGDV
eukprot:31431-Pelagococcus_subviridis.AAC.4